MVKTLIVEDNATFRNTFKEALCQRFPSMEVEEAVDSDQALEKVKAFCPRLIFLDIRIPGESGLELITKIKSTIPGSVIIILTDYDLPEYREAAKKGGADLFIPKSSLNMSRLTTYLQSL